MKNIKNKKFKKKIDSHHRYKLARDNTIWFVLGEKPFITHLARKKKKLG